MNQLESFLQNTPPLAEAVAFLVRLKGEKTASVQEVLKGIDELPAEERAELLKAASGLPLLVAAGQVKKANGMLPGGAPPPGPGARGQNMAPITPTSLPNTAMGVNKVAAARAEEVGKERGRANTAAHFERESHRHGERTGTALGRIAGLAAGAAGAHHLGKGNPMASIAGAALGQHVGAALGRSAGKASDERSFRKHAEAFKEALESMGMQPQGIEPQIAPEMAQYLAVEQEADGVAAQQQLAMVRQKLQEAVAAQQAAEERAQQLETTQATTDQTLAQYQAQVADATQKAMMSQDEILQNQQAAAAMRMAYQQLRGTLLQAASTDPPSLSGNDAALAAASTAAGPSSGPGPAAGPAGQAPAPGNAPNSVAPEGDQTVNRPAQTSEQMNPSGTTYAGNKEQADGAGGRSPGKEVLSSARLPFVDAEKLAALRDLLSNAAREGLGVLKTRGPHAAVGGLIGGGLGFAESQMSNEPLRQKVQELEAKGDDRSVGDAMSLALSRGRLTLGEHAEKHPAAATMAGALMGATTGARGGPAFVDALKSIGGDAKAIGRDTKTLLSK
jgi:hypothetical protein